MPKTSKVDYERRLLAVQGWLIEGTQYALIVKSIIDQGWCESKRHAERMVKVARERWVDFEDESLEKKKKFKIQELKHLKRTLAQKYKGTPEGIKAVLAVEKEIITLEGLRGPQKIELSGDEDKPIAVKHVPSEIDYEKLSDDVLLAIVAARKPSQEET